MNPLGRLALVKTLSQTPTALGTKVFLSPRHSYRKTVTMATRGAAVHSMAHTERFDLPPVFLLPTLARQKMHPPRQDHALPVDFTSKEGKRLFRGAMDQGYAESFFKLMGNFSTQSSPMLGGISSLTMALNALEIDPKQRWKGNWRWYSETLLKTCSSKEEVLRRGMSFDEFACLAQSHCGVTSKRATALSYHQFLMDLETTTSSTSGKNQIMIVSYSRTRLGQHGSSAGHFSPIGSYNKAENKVLIMDVARGQYPSVWVDAETLHYAMLEREQDPLHKSRGYFILQSPPPSPSSTNVSSSSSSPSLISEKRVRSIPSAIRCRSCSRHCLKRQ